LIASETEYNTALGYNTGHSTTTGKANTFIGAEAGYSTDITGNSNTAIGKSAGQALLGGSRNMILGNY
jgi:hypothetical protein